MWLKSSSSEAEALGVARWLIENTALTFSQISKFCDLQISTTETLAQERIKPLPQLIDPIKRGLIEKHEILRCQERETRQLERPIWWRNKYKFSIVESPYDVVPHKVSLKQIYFLHYGRNAWHTTWVERYYKSGSVEGTRRSVEDFAESLRVQGSQFTIEEIPAIVLQSDGVTYICTEINKAGFLLKFIDVFDGPIFTRRIIERFHNIPGNNVLWFSVPENARLIDPSWDYKCLLKSWSSYSKGANQRLEWTPRPFSEMADPVYREIHDRACAALAYSAFLDKKLCLAFINVSEFTPSQVKISTVNNKEHIIIKATHVTGEAYITINKNEINSEALSHFDI